MRGYYYASLETFLNILKHKEIYLSDPLKMNDKLELQWYLRNLNNEKSRDNISCSVFEMMKMRSGIDFTFDDLIKCLDAKGQRSIYISCFSKQLDLLSQWRAYGNDGQGVSIGFNLQKLAEGDNLLISEINYTNDIIQDEIENDVEVVADEIGTVISEHKITNKEMQIEVFLHELMPVLAKYKNPAFSEEEEIRLIYCDDLKFEKIVNSYGAFDQELKLKELEHHFRTVGNNNITEFVKLEFEPECIEDICIGPKCLLKKMMYYTLQKRY